MKRFFLVALLVLGVSSLAFATSMLPKEIRIDESANGTEITMFLGQTLSLSIAENPTTGYRWTIEDFKPSLLEQLEPVFQGPGKEGSVGAGGTKIFGFMAKKVGETPIKLEYQRPWAEKAKPAKTFSVTVKIIKSGSKPGHQAPASSKSGPGMNLGQSLSSIAADLGKLNAEELEQTSCVEFRVGGATKEYVGLIIIKKANQRPRCPNDILPMSNKALLAMAKGLLEFYGKKAASMEPAFLMGGMPQPGFTQVTLVGTGLGLYFNVKTGEPMGKLTGTL